MDLVSSHVEAVDEVTAVRTELERCGLRADVEIDGGVNLDNAKRCVEAGATVIAAATAIFQAPDVAAAARDLALVAGRGD
jgi:ribulose-phosphate 3-epimerase